MPTGQRRRKNKKSVVNEVTIQENEDSPVLVELGDKMDQSDKEEDAEQQAEKPEDKLDQSADEESVELQAEKPEDKPDNVPEDVYGSALFGRKRKAAWEDPDDETIKIKDVAATYKRAPGRHGSKDTSTAQYSQHLRTQFASIHGDPKWAQPKTEEEASDADSVDEEDATALKLTQRAGNLIRKSHLLMPGSLRFKTLHPLNHSTRHEGSIISAVEFHPKEHVGLVGGNGGLLTLFQVDGKKNPKVQTIQLDNFPVKEAHFSREGNEVLAISQRHRHLFAYDMIKGAVTRVALPQSVEAGTIKKVTISPDGQLLAAAGRFGNVYLLSSRTKEWVGTIKSNAQVWGMAFSPDSARLYTHGDEGEVFIWNVKQRRCIHKFMDEGCLQGTSIAISPNQQYLACGSQMGVVNVYNVDNLESTQTPRPIKAVMNLVTQVSSLQFHPSSEILAMASSSKVNAAKLVHLPSLTVFKNFPAYGEEIGRVASLNFSPQGGYLALGNNKGSAPMYRLSHFRAY